MAAIKYRRRGERGRALIYTFLVIFSGFGIVTSLWSIVIVEEYECRLPRHTGPLRSSGKSALPHPNNRDVDKGCLWRFYQDAVAATTATTQQEQEQPKKNNNDEPVSQQTYAINVVFTSDVHGRIRNTCPSDASTAKSATKRKGGWFTGSASSSSTEPCYPGASHLATVVKTVRAATERLGKNEHTVLLDSGDAIFGDPQVNETAVARTMNRLQYDAMALGNHEWDYGRNRLNSFVDRAGFPLLGGNLKVMGDGHLPIEPYVRIPLSTSVTLCLLGITAREDTNPLAGPDVQITDEMSSVRHMLEALKKKSGGEGEENSIVNSGCTRTILMSHAGIDFDRRMSREEGVKEVVDLIIGGHSHVLFGLNPNDSRAPLPETAEFGVVLSDLTNFPHREEQSDRSAIPIAHVGSSGRFAGLLRISWTSLDGPAKVSGEILPLDVEHGVQPDSSFDSWQTKQVFQTLPSSEVDETKAVGITIRSGHSGGGEGSASAAVCGQKCRKGECLLGNLASDAMRFCFEDGMCKGYMEEIESKIGQRSRSIIKALAVIESGTLRACAKTPLDDFSEILPWPNTLVLLTMRGETIKKMLNHGLDSMVNSQGGAFLQTSGLEYTYENASVVDSFLSSKSIGQAYTSNPKDRRLTFDADELSEKSLETCQASSSTVSAARIALSDDDLFVVLVSDWLSGGGDGYDYLVREAETVVHTNVTLREAILNYTAFHRPQVRLEGRSGHAKKKNSSSAIREGISAFLGGGLAFLISYPLYTIMVRRSMSKSIQCNFGRLFDGAFLGFFASAVSDALYFVIYHMDFLSRSSSFVRSGVAAFANSVATTPLWVVVTHKQLSEKKVGIFSIARSIYDGRGLRGFFDSLTINLLMCIFPIVRQVTMETILRIFAVSGQSQVALVASISSIIATVITYPIQKARIMLQSGEPPPKVSSMWHVLFDGILFKVADTCLKTFILFLVKEHSSTLLCILEL